MRYTKIFFILLLLIAFSFLTALFLIAFNLIHVQQSLNSASPIIKNNSVNVITNNSNINLKTLSSDEVAKHNSASDCWMIVNGKVYDLTSLISSHSGGSAAILKDCGKDGSVGFNTKDTGRSHSTNAKNILDSMYLGDLNQQVNSNVVQNTSQNIAKKTIPRSGEDD